MSNKILGPNIAFWHLYLGQKDYMTHQEGCGGQISQPIHYHKLGRAFCEKCNRLVGKKAWREMESMFEKGTLDWAPINFSGRRYCRVFMQREELKLEEPPTWAEEPCDPYVLMETHDSVTEEATTPQVSLVFQNRPCDWARKLQNPADAAAKSRAELEVQRLQTVHHNLENNTIVQQILDKIKADALQKRWRERRNDFEQKTRSRRETRASS